MLQGPKYAIGFSEYFTCCHSDMILFKNGFLAKIFDSLLFALVQSSEAYLGPLQHLWRSLAALVNDWKLLTNATKSSILDVTGIQETPLVLNYIYCNNNGMCFLAILIIHSEKEDMFAWNSNDVMAPKISQILRSLVLHCRLWACKNGDIFENVNVINYQSFIRSKNVSEY